MSEPESLCQMMLHASLVLSLNELHFSLSIMPNMFVLQRLYFFINHVTLQHFYEVFYDVRCYLVLPNLPQCSKSHPEYNALV